MMSRTGLPGVVSTGSANFGRHVRHPLTPRDRRVCMCHAAMWELLAVGTSGAPRVGQGQVNRLSPCARVLFTTTCLPARSAHDTQLQTLSDAMHRGISARATAPHRLRARASPHCLRALPLCRPVARCPCSSRSCAIRTAINHRACDHRCPPSSPASPALTVQLARRRAQHAARHRAGDAGMRLPQPGLDHHHHHHHHGVRHRARCYPAP